MIKQKVAREKRISNSMFQIPEKPLPRMIIHWYKSRYQQQSFRIINRPKWGETNDKWLFPNDYL